MHKYIIEVIGLYLIQILTDLAVLRLVRKLCYSTLGRCRAYVGNVCAALSRAHAYIHTSCTTFGRCPEAVHMFSTYAWHGPRVHYHSFLTSLRTARSIKVWMRYT